MTISDPSPSKTNGRAAVYGEALRRLRRQSGLGQVEAASAAGLSQAAWAKYEKGRTLAFLNLLNQEKCVGALGRTLADLEAMRAIVEAGDDGMPVGVFPPPAEATAGAFGVHEAASQSPWLDEELRRLVVAEDAMPPYVEAGEVIVYSLALAPQAGKGVVIVHRGEKLVRLYLGMSAGHLTSLRLDTSRLDGQAAFIAREEAYAVDEIDGIYPIVLRGEMNNIP